ncbi:hypothetical protein M8998_03860 [Sphingobacterium sp. lm-10]|uniref:hypothetical protein n=1 Tax=Sphingobacterium sp. lm-10 TaxID=2944904 RepID=UPI00202234FC|nr:hypothetical protein [Sphingobacterium sp. lm-10]MCL7987074.1 hypothetical protein [Sphingobacterium sp. lm-10]
MMIKLIFFMSLLTTAFLVQNCHSSAVHPSAGNRPRPDWLKSELHHVVTIEQSNTATQEGFFLIDHALSCDAASVPVFFIQAHIPFAVFRDLEGFYPELPEFILVIPDWEFYNKIAEEATKNGISIEPATTNYYYQVSRANGSVTVDEYHISGDGHPQFNFEKPVASKADLVVYRTEQYGAICCPRDERHALSDKDATFIQGYEKQHGVKIKGTYRQNRGDEGEYSTYYTLQGLSARERLAFLLAKNTQWQWNNQGVFDPQTPRIITPTRVLRAIEEYSKIQLITY